MTDKRTKGLTPMDAALKYLTFKPRTVREVELHLDGKEFGEYEVYQVVERLKELNYLNDEKYAQDFVVTRLATKPVSRNKLKEQMYSHSLPRDIIDEALLAVTDEMEQENALQVAKKFAAQFSALEAKERKLRVIRRLLGRGFGYDAVRRGVEQAIGELGDIDVTALQPEDCGEE